MRKGCKMFVTICFAIMIVMAYQDAYARMIEPEDYSDLVPIKIETVYDGIFTERVELYANGYPAT